MSANTDVWIQPATGLPFKARLLERRTNPECPPEILVEYMSVVGIDKAWLYARQITDDPTKKGAGMKHAITQLQIALATVEINAPIHEAEGKTEQAQYERDCAQSYRKAIAALESR